MKFESIRGNMKRFSDLIHAHGGPDGMIKFGIPWEKVVWGRTVDTDKRYFKFRKAKDDKGELNFFVQDEEGNLREWSKRDIAYSCDLYDKDGKLLNIMFWGL